jgi:hypothetical protein
VSDADGAMRWKLDIGSEKDFRTDLQIIASRFLPTADVRSLFAPDGTPVTAPSLGVMTFSHESFLKPKVARFRFDNPPVVLPAFRTLVPKLSWFTTRRNSIPGRFRGNVQPGDGGVFPFSGVLFPKQRMGEGFFLKRAGSGTVTVEGDGM